MKGILNCLVVAALIFVSRSGLAQAARADPLNPTTYSSRSGVWKCYIDPSDPRGLGPAQYRVTRDGQLAWAAEKPFTLYEAAVTDNGRVVGYAYSHGIEGWAPSSETNVIRLFLLDEHGKVLLEETKKRSLRFMHDWAEPMGTGIDLDETKDRFTIHLKDRVTDGLSRIWEGSGPQVSLSFRISDGKQVGYLRGPATTRRGPATTRREDADKSNDLPPSFRVSEIPPGTLPELGSFVFAPKMTNARIGNIHQFKFDGQGRIGLLRRDEKEYSFMLVDEAGRILSDFKLEELKAIEPQWGPRLAWVAGDRWVLIASTLGENAKAYGWWVSALQRAVTAIDGFEAPLVDAVTGSGQGFVTLGTVVEKYSRTDEVSAYGPEGTLRWRKREEGYEGKDDDLLSPEDITTTTDGEIAILDNIRDSVQYFSLAGKFLRIIPLNKAWGRKPNYPSDLAADRAGGVLIKDFHGNPQLVRMDKRGQVWAEFNPRHADGRALDATQGVAVSPSGRVWVSDGQSVARLTDNGVVDLVLGSAPDEETLGEIAVINVDRSGVIYAVDKRTGSVHVFDAAGKRLRVCKTAKDDFKAELSSARIALQPDGGLFLGDYESGVEFVHFDSAGKRTGKISFPIRAISPKLFVQKSGEFVLIEYSGGRLFTADRKIKKHVLRRPDNRWLDTTDEGFLGADDSFAIISEPGTRQERPWPVSIYSASGEPLRMLVMPGGCTDFAYSAKHSVTRIKNELIVLDRSGKPLLKMPITREWAEASMFITKDDTELWLVDENRTVWRFKLPKE